MRIHIHSRKGKVFMEHKFGKGKKKFQILSKPGKSVGIILDAESAIICIGDSDLSTYRKVVDLDKEKNLFIDLSKLVDDTVELETYETNTILPEYKKMSYTDIQFLLEDSISSYKWSDKTKLTFDSIRIITEEVQIPCSAQRV